MSCVKEDYVDLGSFGQEMENISIKSLIVFTMLDASAISCARSSHKKE